MLLVISFVEPEQKFAQSYCVDLFIMNYFVFMLFFLIDFCSKM
jgi:hypothetical protein